MFVDCAVNRRLRTLQRCLGEEAVYGGHRPLDESGIRVAEAVVQFRVDHARVEAVCCHAVDLGGWKTNRTSGRNCKQCGMDEVRRMSEFIVKCFKATNF